MKLNQVLIKQTKGINLRIIAINIFEKLTKSKELPILSMEYFFVSLY